MTVTAAEAQATLEYLVPGFLALKLFYLLGLRTRRSDLAWTVLSVAAAAGLNGVATNILGVGEPGWRAIDATAIGLLTAIAAAALWRPASRRFPRLRIFVDRQAWDRIYLRPTWVQVWLRDGPIILGAPTVFSESADTDEHDVFLVRPEWVEPVAGTRSPMDRVDGVWVAARDIKLIQVLEQPSAEVTPAPVLERVALWLDQTAAAVRRLAVTLGRRA